MEKPLLLFLVNPQSALHRPDEESRPLFPPTFYSHVLLNYYALVNLSQAKPQLPCSIDQSLHHCIHSLHPLARLRGSCDFAPPSPWILTFREWGPANEMLIQLPPCLNVAMGWPCAVKTSEELWHCAIVCCLLDVRRQCRNPSQPTPPHTLPRPLF